MDYFETFSPVARIDTIRTVLALAAQKRWKVYQFDVKSAFLNGELEEEEKMISKFEMTDLGILHYFLVNTPMNANEKFLQDDGVVRTDPKEFRSLVGGLIYITHSRPDIMFPVSLLSRFMQNPSKNHFGATKRVIRYIHGTLKFGIRYHHVNDFKLVSYTDSDWASCVDDRKSTSGFALTLGSGMGTFCMYSLTS
ncbi:uncharacterized mitochondrial protein AtMg00810-like [Cornus florida]|uniref:uncharacterized mitochondrial protein AtMg00810-like n=1 Tax=Cornus florida TaxID=4283 RepID=UPI00289E80DC|nr:uncharacterized mitochondrial protein AtMg00810-like [Cornus florida]